MKIGPEPFPLADGRTLVLKSAEPEDAAAMVQYLNTIAAETPFLTRWPEEAAADYNAEKEAGFLQSLIEAPNRLMLTLFDADGRVVGNAGIHPHAPTMKERHRADLGIALVKDYWHLGLGTRLLERSIAEAWAMGYEQLELSVFSSNERAIALYARQGFRECGRTPNAFKLRDGTYNDDVLMYLPL